MRVLFVTNYYPPFGHGWGYMQLCEEVADGLAAKGHEIAVLTSSWRDGPDIARAYAVHRLLTIDPDWHCGRSAAWQFFVGRRRRERHAIDQLHRLVAHQRPDVIFVWNAIGLPRVLLQAAEQLPNCATAYYLADYLPERPDEYIAYWQASPVRASARLLKRPLARLALALLASEGKPVRLRYDHTVCVSNYVRQRLVCQGLIPATSVVIHNGVNLQGFQSERGVRDFSKAISLLHAGRLEPAKGVHLVLEALALLPQERREHVRQVAIVGAGEEHYRLQLSELAEQLGLSNLVRFKDPIARRQMPDLLEQFDVLVLPSSLEALSRMMQEAMAMGMLVIGTATGGSCELLVQEETGLTFEAGDAQSLAAQIERVIQEPDLAAHLALMGQRVVREHFDIERTIRAIEDYLSNVLRTGA